MEIRLTDADVEEFQRLWREVFGEELSLKEARTEATRLLEFYTLIAKVTPPETLPPSGSL